MADSRTVTVMETFGAEFGLDPEAAPMFRTKASAWRGLISALEEESLTERAMEAVPSEVVALFRDPPAGGIWIPAVAFQYVFRALDAHVDDEQMRRIARHSMKHGSIPVLRPVVESLLRIMGANPGRMMRRVPKIVSQQIQGMRLEVPSIDEQWFRARIEYEYVNGLPRATFTFWQGVLWGVFDICKVEPVRHEMSIGLHRAACEYEFHWD